MEQTLGKRIAENRKKLGMTQDALAEKLGITAQAVSKWENDQSCPDITVLPKLAEIFGITTDELLGREAPQRVHEAEVVDDDGPCLNIDQDESGKWEVHWDNSKRSSVTFAVLVLLVGLLTLCNRVLNWNASFWSILWPSVLLVCGVEGICRRFSIFKIGMVLIGGAYLVNNLGFVDLDLLGDWLFPVIVILVGLSLLIDALKKPNKPHFSITRGGKRMASSGKDTKSSYTQEENRFDCSLSFGERKHYVSLDTLAGGEASVSFGELCVDLTGCRTLEDGCTVTAQCSFGELELRVPRRFRVDCHDQTAFGGFDIQGHPDADATQVLYIDANASFGQITVRYV